MFIFWERTHNSEPGQRLCFSGCVVVIVTMEMHAREPVGHASKEKMI